ncbi:LysR substrate-binding domain-containing protein, partial [Escherichia coli]|nr:LysR substrate-binding domain-containing protein [Escherichia coli]
RDAWTFSTIDAAIDAVMYQVGFGWLPEERIRPHLDQGVLKRLPLSHGARRATPLHLLVKRDLAPIDEQVATLLALFRTP